MTDKKLNLVCLICIAGLAAVVFLPWLGSITLFDIDETLFADAAREMGLTGNYIVPYFNGKVFYDKPPLMYWVMIAGYRVFGVNELGARIGSALAGIGSCLLIFVLAKEMFGRRAAVIAAVVAVVATLIWVVVDEFLVDFGAWIPGVPPVVANGVVPVVILFGFLGGFYLWFKKQGNESNNEMIQAMVILLATGFAVLTIVGVWFRGAGMALVWPWNL